MNILITGGAGFIGSNLALKLIEMGHFVRVIDNLSTQVHGDNPITTSPLYRSIYNKVHFIKGDILNQDIIQQTLNNIDVVVHYAAETGTGQSMYNIFNYTNVNVTGTSLLLDILTNSKSTIKKVVLASSRSIYGEGSYLCETHGVVFPNSREDIDLFNGEFNCKCPKCNLPVKTILTDENSRISPSSVYGISKYTQEILVHQVCKAIGIKSIALRYQNVYGPGQSLSNPYTGIISIFSQLLKNNKKIRVFEDGLESRDFVYIDDVIHATVKAIMNDDIQNESYNVGSGVYTTVSTVVEKMLEFIPSRSIVEITGEYRIGDIRHNAADLKKIKSDLGFYPQVDFSIGLNNFCKWSSMFEIQSEGNYEKSLDEMELKMLFKKSKK